MIDTQLKSVKVKISTELYVYFPVSTQIWLRAGLLVTTDTTADFNNSTLSEIILDILLILILYDTDLFYVGNIYYLRYWLILYYFLQKF